jgi:hypothetical protein
MFTVPIAHEIDKENNVSYTLDHFHQDWEKCEQ